MLAARVCVLAWMVASAAFCGLARGMNAAGGDNTACDVYMHMHNMYNMYMLCMCM